MSNFSGNELNAWRLTKRESRLFPSDSLKFHSFVVEAGSKLRCGRKGSPHAVKIRRSAGKATVAPRLTYCGCHVENVDIVSAVKLCSGDDGCIPDCGCRFGDCLDGTVDSSTFMPQKDHQMRHNGRAMKRSASSVPRPRKVAKVSDRQEPITQKQNSVDTSGISRLQPSVIDCGVTIPNDSPSSKCTKKRGKGKLPVEQPPQLRQPSVQLQRLPAEVVECYLSRPTVLLLRLPDRLHQCQVSSSQESPVASPSATGKRFKPDPNPELDIKNTREVPVTSASDCQTRSKSETRAGNLEKRKTSSSNLSTEDKLKNRSTNAISVADATKSPQKEAPVTSASDCRTRSKSETRAGNLEKRKKRSSNHSTVDKLKSRSTNSISVADATKSPQKELQEASSTPGHESRLHSKSELEPEALERQRSNSDLMTVHKSKTSSTNSLSVDDNNKPNQKVSCHLPTCHSSSSTSALANSLQPKSPLKSGGLCAEAMKSIPLLKVDGLPELTINNRSTTTVNESLREVYSQSPLNESQTNSETGLQEQALEKREDRSGSPQKPSSESVQHRSKTGIADVVTGGHKNSASKMFPTAAPEKSKNEIQISSKEKPLKRKRGRGGRFENKDGRSLVEPKDRNKDGDQNFALEIHSESPLSGSQLNSEARSQVQALESGEERSGSPQKLSNESVQHKSEVAIATVVTVGHKNSALKEVPATSPRESRTRSKSEQRPEILEKRKRNNIGVKTEDKLKSTRTNLADADDSSPAQKIHCRPSRESSKSASNPEYLGRRKSKDLKGATATVMKTAEESADKKHAQEQAPVTSASVRGKRSKPQKLDHQKGKKMKRSDQSSSDQDKSRNAETVDTGSSIKPAAHEESPVASENECQRRSKSEPKPEGLEKRRRRSSSGPRAEDKVKRPTADSISATDTKKSIQKEAPVTPPKESQRPSKPESRPEGLEKRTWSSNGSRTDDKVDSPTSNSVNANVNRKSTQKESPVTSESEPQRSSKSEPRPEGREKRTRNSSGSRIEDKVKSQKPPVLSETERQRHSKPELRPEGLEKRTRSRSGQRTEDKVKSPTADSYSAADTRKSTQKESPVTSEAERQKRSRSGTKQGGLEKRMRSRSDLRTEDKVKSQKPPVPSETERRRRSKSESRLEGLGKRTRSKSDLRTEDKVKSQKPPVPSEIERRKRSKSEPRLEGPEKIKRSRSGLRTEAEVESPTVNSINAGDTRKSTKKDSPVSSETKLRRRSKSEPRLEGLEKKMRNSSGQKTEEKLESPTANSINVADTMNSTQKGTSVTLTRESPRSSEFVLRPVSPKKRKSWSNDLRPVENVNIPDIDVIRESAHQESAVASRRVFRQRSKSEPKPEALENRSSQISDLERQVKSPSRDVMNGDIGRKSPQKIHQKAHIDLSVHTEKIEHRHPHKVPELFDKFPSKLERSKAYRYQNYNSNKPQDVSPTLPYPGDSHMNTTQKLLESLAPSPSCRSIRSMLSESLTSLNSLSSEGTEIESPAYEPLGSSPVCMQNSRDYLEEFQKTKVISPSCRSDCCTLRESQGSTSSPPKIQILNNSAIRRLSDVFNALPSAPEGETANRRTADEQKQKYLAAVEEDGNVTPCHEVDSSFIEEWSKSIREADQVANAGFVPKYHKKSLRPKGMCDGVPTGKQLISPQKLSSASPVNQKIHNIAMNRQVLLGWEPLQSPSNCDPNCKTDDTVTLDINDSETSDSEEDCVITDIRPRSSLSVVTHKTPPLHLREDTGISRKVMERRNLGKSLTDIRPEQQIDKFSPSKGASSLRKRQNSNNSQFQSSTCHCRPKPILRRCRSASPRLYYVRDCAVPEDDEDDDDDECVPCDDTTISRLQQINERIKLLENSEPPVNPIWRQRRKNNAACLENGGVRKVMTGGDEEDVGGEGDDNESVIVLDEPNRLISPRSPSCSPPPDLEVKQLSPVHCGSLTVENVNKHNMFMENSHSGPSSSLSLSVCGVSDSDDSFHSAMMVTPRTSDWESSFAGASTTAMNGLSDYSLLTTPCRSGNSSKNESTSNIDLPTCSTLKTRTLTVHSNGPEMLYMFSSPSSCVSEEVSPIFNRKRNPLHKGGENGLKCIRPPNSVSEVSMQYHFSNPATPDLSTARTNSTSTSSHSTDDVQEIDFTSPENGVSSTSEGELAQRNRKTPTQLRCQMLSPPPPARLQSPPYLTDEQSSESSMERPNSISSMEKSMLLHLCDEMRRVPPMRDGIMREEEDTTSAGNDSICVDGSHSSSDSEDLDDEQKDSDAEVVAEGFGLQITRADLATLSGTNWLNDKIVNFYLKLLTERGRQNREPEVYAYDTFFFPKLIKCGFPSVKKWTRVVDVFKHDILIIPVHLGTHWCMTAVDFRKQTVVYYDSMGGKNESCLKTIWNYLHQECAERSVEPLSEEVWQLQCAEDIPMQSNNSDCGVFMCKYAECITRDAELDFSQSDMPAIRIDMMQEIQTMTLLHQ